MTWGLALMGLGLLALSTLSRTADIVLIECAFLSIGVGLGFNTGPLLSVAVSAAPKAHAGAAAGVVNTARMPAPTREERSALTKSASPPTKQTFRENRIEVAFSDRIEDTACISSTAWTISIMEKVASWVALDRLRPGGLAPPRAARASIRAAFEASGRQGCHVVALD
jgi:hypothetical protein